MLTHKLYNSTRKKISDWHGKFVYKLESTDFNDINNSYVLSHSVYFRKAITLYFLYNQ